MGGNKGFVAEEKGCGLNRKVINLSHETRLQGGPRHYDLGRECREKGPLQNIMKKKSIGSIYHLVFGSRSLGTRTQRMDEKTDFGSVDRIRSMKNSQNGEWTREGSLGGTPLGIDDRFRGPIRHTNTNSYSREPHLEARTESQVQQKAGDATSQVRGI